MARLLSVFGQFHLKQAGMRQQLPAITADLPPAGTGKDRDDGEIAPAGDSGFPANGLRIGKDRMPVGERSSSRREAGRHRISIGSAAGGEIGTCCRARRRSRRDDAGRPERTGWKI